LSGDARAGFAEVVILVEEELPGGAFELEAELTADGFGDVVERQRDRASREEAVATDEKKVGAGFATVEDEDGGGFAGFLASCGDRACQGKGGDEGAGGLDFPIGESRLCLVETIGRGRGHGGEGAFDDSEGAILGRNGRVDGLVPFRKLGLGDPLRGGLIGRGAKSALFGAEEDERRDGLLFRLRENGLKRFGDRLGIIERDLSELFDGICSSLSAGADQD